MAGLSYPVVVDASREAIYGPFRSYKDAEEFSEVNSMGSWAVINLDDPNYVRPDSNVTWNNQVPEHIDYVVQLDLWVRKEVKGE
jgi:hypothetical protein